MSYTILDLASLAPKGDLVMSTPNIRPRPQGKGNETAFSVRVQPGATHNRVLGFRDGTLRVSVAAPPRDGKANAALLSLLAETLGVARSRLRIVRGHSSRDKVVAVDGLAAVEVIGILNTR